MPDARLLTGAAALFGLGAAGLGVPAPVPRTDPPGTIGTSGPDPAWPDLLHRWLGTAHGGLVPRAETAQFAGSGRMRLGRSPWLPVSYRTNHLLGRAFVADVAATWFGRPIVRGADALVDGRCITRARDTLTTGPGLDSSAVSFLWSEAILAPSTWGLAGVRWTQRDNTALDLDVTGPDLAAPLSATIVCDADSGLPRSFRVPWRAKDADGRLGSEWLVRWQEWRPVDGAWAPALVEVQWLDEERPWLRLRMGPPVLQVDITEALDSARRLLANRA